MKNHTNELVRNNFTHKLVSDLEKKSDNNLKLSFNKNSSLNLYLVITDFAKAKHLGKSYTVKRPISKTTDLFQKLLNSINGKKEILLLKVVNTNGSFYWIKALFIIETTNLITFTIDTAEISFNNSKHITKLTDIMEILERKLNKTAVSKYLDGYLEEMGIVSYRNFINCL